MNNIRKIKADSQSVLWKIIRDKDLGFGYTMAILFILIEGVIISTSLIMLSKYLLKV